METWGRLISHHLHEAYVNANRATDTRLGPTGVARRGSSSITGEFILWSVWCQASYNAAQLTVIIGTDTNNVVEIAGSVNPTMIANVHVLCARLFRIGRYLLA